MITLAQLLGGRASASLAGVIECPSMKFLCLDCDAPMKLHSTEGPDEGSLTVTFRCPECGFRVAMLTNPFETQMVRSLGIKVGGGAPETAPFEHVRTMMTNPRADAFEVEVGAGAEAAGCPFAAMVNEGATAVPSGRRRPRRASSGSRRSSGRWPGAPSSGSPPSADTRPSTRP